MDINDIKSREKSICQIIIARTHANQIISSAFNCSGRTEIILIIEYSAKTSCARLCIARANYIRS